MSQRFGWFRNKYQSGGGATFTPSVVLNEVITANGSQYQATITSNIPNATIKYNLNGNILASEILDGITTANITLDSGGNATLIKDFNTSVTSNTHTFNTVLTNPNTNDTFTTGNTITFSGNINLNTQVYTTDAFGGGGSTPLAPQGNATVGNVTYTSYKFDSIGVTNFVVTSFANNLDIQGFAVGGGGGSGGVGNTPGGGGAGGGLTESNIVNIRPAGHIYDPDYDYSNSIFPCSANVGSGGNAGANVSSGTSGDGANGTQTTVIVNSNVEITGFSLIAPPGSGGRSPLNGSGIGSTSGFQFSYGAGGFGQAPGGGSQGANATTPYRDNFSGMGGLSGTTLFTSTGTQVGSGAQANIRIAAIYDRTSSAVGGSSGRNSLLVQLWPLKNDGSYSAAEDPTYLDQIPFYNGAKVSFGGITNPDFTALNGNSYYVKWQPNSPIPNQPGRGYEIYTDADLTANVDLGTGSSASNPGRLYSDPVNTVAITARSALLVNQGGTGPSADIGYGGNGGAELYYDFTGSNVAYSGGGGGAANGTISGYVNGADGYTFLNKGSGGGITWNGSSYVKSAGQSGIAYIRLPQNGDRALSM